jgi:hypothetical protein
MKKEKNDDFCEYYFNDSGFVVFTEEYLITRGYCCGNGCMHCPYLFKNVPEPKKSKLLIEKNGRK